jgi:Kyakuja-Dileera-Zisupton transposase
MELFGPTIGFGYDVACSFRATAKHIPYFRDKIADVSWACGIFHSYAHARMCQLNFNPRLIRGFGLDDLEGCERLYQITNLLAPTTRTASRALRHWRIQDKHELINFERLEALGMNLFGTEKI